MQESTEILMYMAVSPTQGIRLISVFLLVLGVLWGLTFLIGVGVLGGLLVHVPPFSVSLMAKLLSLFIGPLLLVSGAVTVLSRRQLKRGSFATLIGCAIMTAFAAYQGVVVIQELSNPALMSPPWATYAVFATVIILADMGAIRMYRSIS